MVTPDFAAVGVAVPLTAIVKENGERDMASGVFDWSTGDGGHYLLTSNQPLTHIFYYPGTYTMVLTYYSSSAKPEPDSIHKRQIVVVPDSVMISSLTDDGGVVLSNQTSKDLDLEGWTLHSGAYSFTFPEYTVVPSGGTLSISSNTLGFVIPQAGSAVLLNPIRRLVDSYPASETSTP